MTTTWIAIGLLAVITTLVLLRPLFRKIEREASRADYDITVYRDQLKEVENDLADGLLSETEAEAARTEIKRRMLAASEDETDDTETKGLGKPAHLAVRGFVVVALLSSVGLYSYLGSPEYADQPLATRDARFVQKPANSDAPGSMEEAIAKLAERMEKDQDNLEGWLMLGRSYIQIDRFDKAADAYRKAYALKKDDTNIASDFGELLFMVNKGKFTEEAKSIFADALAQDAFAYKARFYLGLAKARDQKFHEALQDWADLIAISPPDAPWLSVTFDQMGEIAKGLKIDPASVKPTKTAMDLASANPDKLKPMALPEEEAQGKGAALTQEQRDAVAEMTPEEQQNLIRTMVDQLAERLKDNPDDIDGWMRLARSYEVLGEKEKAEEVRKKIRSMSQ